MTHHPPHLLLVPGPLLQPHQRFRLGNVGLKLAAGRFGVQQQPRAREGNARVVVQRWGTDLQVRGDRSGREGKGETVERFVWLAIPSVPLHPEFGNSES